MEAREADDDLPQLGSLAQSARIKELNNARNMMFLAAVLLVVMAIIEFATLRNQASQVIRQNPNQFGPNADLKQVEDIIAFLGALLAGGILVLAGVFVAFAFLVKKFPVPITIIGLCLYILFNLVLAVLNPVTILQGWIFKLIITIGLVKGIQSAFVYQKEKRFEDLERGYE